MGLNVRKIFSIAGGIAATVSTGGLAAPILIPQILSGLADLLPEGETAEEIAGKAELDNWERARISDWVEHYKVLTARPLGDLAQARPRIGNLAQVFEGYLYAEFAFNYADEPEDDWLVGVHEMIANGVRWQIANGIA